MTPFEAITSVMAGECWVGRILVNKDPAGVLSPEVAGSFAVQLGCDLEQPELGFHVQAVAGLRLEGGGALAEGFTEVARQVALQGLVRRRPGHRERAPVRLR